MTWLPDVNVLVALIWEAHVHHAAAQRWFAGLSEAPWGTATITQSGFVRVSANPRVLADAVSVREALGVLAELVAHPGHQLLRDVDGFVNNALVPLDRLVGPRQVTDAHLVAIARQHHAVIATFDRSMIVLDPDNVRVLPS